MYPNGCLGSRREEAENNKFWRWEIGEWVGYEHMDESLHLHPGRQEVPRIWIFLGAWSEPGWVSFGFHSRISVIWSREQPWKGGFSLEHRDEQSYNFLWTGNSWAVQTWGLEGAEGPSKCVQSVPLPNWTAKFQVRLTPSWLWFKLKPVPWVTILILHLKNSDTSSDN